MASDALPALDARLLVTRFLDPALALDVILRDVWVIRDDMLPILAVPSFMVESSKSSLTRPEDWSVAPEPTDATEMEALGTLGLYGCRTLSGTEGMATIRGGFGTGGSRL